jgi:polysaccharide biosynthesis protein PslH
MDVDVALPTVLTIHNVHANPAFQPWLTPRQRVSVLDRELGLARRVSRVIVFSDKELSRLQDASQQIAYNAAVVPIGHPNDDPGPRVPAVDVVPGLRGLLVGSMDYEPNLDSALRLVRWWPELREAGHLSSLAIVGRKAGAVVKQIGTLPDGVEVHPDVPDLGPYYRAADVCVMPIFVGGGTRMKAIEAMAWSVPIVATPLAVEGLGLVDGVNVLLAEDMDGFTAELRKLRDQPYREAVGEEARRQWESEHSASRCAEQVSQIYQMAVELGVD